MRRIHIHDTSSGYTSVKEITLSSTSGVNKETYMDLSTSANTENDKANVQSQILSGVVESINQLTKIVNNMNDQKPTDVSNMIFKTVDVEIDNINARIQYIGVNNDGVPIPNNTYLKSLKLDVEKPFFIGTKIILFFNNTIFATINITDTSIPSYEMNINKYIEYVDGASNNMNLQITFDPGDNEIEDIESAKATLHLTLGYTDNVI